MSHQDQAVPLVSNHHTIKQVLDWLLAPAVFANLPGGSQATWKPRMLAAAAVLWATSELSTLHARFVQARKIITKVLRWQRAPGVSAQGILKMLGKWQDELLGALLSHLREQRQEVLPAQWETAGSVVFAGDGSRVALARSKSLEAIFAPVRRRRTAVRRKKTAGTRRSPKYQVATARHKKATSPQLWLTLLWHVGSGLPWAWRRALGQMTSIALVSPGAPSVVIVTGVWGPRLGRADPRGRIAPRGAAVVRAAPNASALKSLNGLRRTPAPPPWPRRSWCRPGE